MAACGGGGGGMTSNPSPVSNTVSSSSSTPSSSSMTSSSSSSFEDERNSFETSEYYSNWGLEKINASAAYARGATGEGTLIGIMDSGVDTSHQELDSVNKFTSDSYLSYQTRFPNTEERRHGTHVSGIAVGDKDGSGMHGVAFDAQLYFISIELSDPPEDYDPVTIDETVDFTAIDNAWSQLEDLFVQREVTVVNGSFGYQGNINDYEEENLRYAFPRTIEVLAQANKPDYDKTIFVWSAGNGGGYADEGVDFSSPEVFGGMAYLLPELQNHSVAVVSIDSTGEISSFSNLCGVAKDYCIAAPGRSIYSAYSQDSPINNSYASWSGTSMAAPHVSGGIALLADYFRGQLGNTEILQRLFLTANKTGIYADAEIYGQGLMDLDAATSPVGQSMVITVTKNLFPAFLTSVTSFGSAAGDGWINLLDKEFAVFDQLEAPFFRQLDSTHFDPRFSLEWLTYRYTNPLLRTLEVKHNESEETSLILGLKLMNYGEHNYAPSLWAKDEQKMRYFSLQKKMSEKMHYFIGSGISPFMHFGTKTINEVFGKPELSSPYLGFGENGNFVGGFLSLPKNNKLSASFFAGNHRDKELFNTDENNKGLVVEYQRSLSDLIISIQTGILTENSGLLGSSFKGGYGNLNDSLTYFSGIETLLSLQEVKANLTFFVGQTEADLNSKGIITGIENLTSSSFSFSLLTESLVNKGDAFGFRISQPLRLEEGAVHMSIPVGRTKNKDFLFQEYSSDLSPSGRQVDFEFIYKTPVKFGYISSKLGFTRDEGHFKREKTDSFFETSFEIVLH